MDRYLRTQDLFGDRTNVPIAELIATYWKYMQGDNGYFLLVKNLSATSGVMTLVPRNDRSPVCREMIEKNNQRSTLAFFRHNQKDAGRGALTYISRSYYQMAGLELMDMPDATYGFTSLEEARTLELQTMLYNNSKQLRELLLLFMEAYDPEREMLVYAAGYPFEFNTGLVFLFFTVPFRFKR